MGRPKGSDAMSEMAEDFYNTISTSSNSDSNTNSGYINRQLPSHIGIDKLHIRIPLVPEDTDGSSAVWKKPMWIDGPNGRVFHRAEAHIELLPRMNVHLIVRDLGRVADIQFNPSRVMDAAGSSLCSVEVLEATVRFILGRLQHLITPSWMLNKETGEIGDTWPGDWLEKVTVTRLDIAADFTSYIPFKVELVQQQVAGRLKRLEPTLNKGKVNTLTWGKQPWIRHVFYDKGAHPEHRDSMGVFRFECQLHREFLKKTSLRQLSEITANRVLEILEERFVASRLGVPFSFNGGLSHLCDALDATVSSMKANGFLGVALRLSHGLDSGCNPKTLADYRSIGESIGFALGNPLESLGYSKYRLDWRTGIIEKIH